MDMLSLSCLCHSSSQKNAVRTMRRRVQEGSAKAHTTLALVHAANTTTAFQYQMCYCPQNIMVGGAIWARSCARACEIQIVSHTSVLTRPTKPLSGTRTQLADAASCIMPLFCILACWRCPYFPAPPSRMACRMRPPPGTGCGPLKRPSCAWPLARASCDRMSCAAAQFSRLPAHVCARRERACQAGFATESPKDSSQHLITLPSSRPLCAVGLPGIQGASFARGCCSTHTYIRVLVGHFSQPHTALLMQLRKRTLSVADCSALP